MNTKEELYTTPALDALLQILDGVGCQFHVNRYGSMKYLYGKVIDGKQEVEFYVTDATFQKQNGLTFLRYDEEGELLTDKLTTVVRVSNWLTRRTEVDW